MERKDDKSFERDIIVLISFPILFVSTSFLVNIGKEMSLPGFRNFLLIVLLLPQQFLIALKSPIHLGYALYIICMKTPYFYQNHNNLWIKRLFSICFYRSTSDIALFMSLHFLQDCIQGRALKLAAQLRSDLCSTVRTCTEHEHKGLIIST